MKNSISNLKPLAKFGKFSLGACFPMNASKIFLHPFTPPINLNCSLVLITNLAALMIPSLEMSKHIAWYS